MTITWQIAIAFIVACGGVATAISAIAGVVVSILTKTRAPEVAQNARLDALEKENKEMREEIDSIKSSLNEHEGNIGDLCSENMIVMRAILALLSHGISGNATDAMTDSQKEIMNYLTSKTKRGDIS